MANKRNLVPASVREAVPAAALTEKERQVLEVVAGEGLSSRSAFLLIYPHAESWQPQKITAAYLSIMQRGQAYLRELVSAGAEEAAIGRATLIQMALQDREFARETGNAGAAVAATKNVAALCGISMKEPGESGPTDPVALLEAVERLMRAGNGADAIDISPRASEE
jgi:hypothetical protein